MTRSYAADLKAMPANLRALLEAELAAGNDIAEVGHSFPAPPVGAYFKLTKPLQTRAKGLPDGLHYRDRKSSSYSGAVTDEIGYFLLLEPPHPPEPEPDMDAIRAAHQPEETHDERGRPLKAAPSAAPKGPNEETLLELFERSMVIDYDKWHDGIGYDLSVLRAMNAIEQSAVESLLVRRGMQDWRDVEALAEIDTPTARAVIKASMNDSNAEIRNAVTQYAPQLIPQATRIKSLIRGLESAVIFGGLGQTLDQVAELHPPEVVDVLFRCALNRTGDVAVHFAAMLCYIFGKANVPFDMAQRPFFLRFNTEVRAEREAVFRELCTKLGVKPDPYLRPKAAPSRRVEEKNVLPDYRVEVDRRGETLTYLEATRSAKIICTFGAEPCILGRTLSDWWYPGTNKTETMTVEEKQLVLARIADECRVRHGMTDLVYEWR
ncbi:MAG: hypothetical protein ABIZ04_06795 [Opitutus sp.]